MKISTSTPRLLYGFIAVLLTLNIVSCSTSDDVQAIFTGRTWKLNYISTRNGHTMIDLWGGNDAAEQTSMASLNLPTAFLLTFTGAAAGDAISGSVTGVAITASFTGTWSANGNSGAFSANITGGGDSDPLAREYIKGLNAATSYEGDSKNLYILYKDGQQDRVLVFFPKK